MKILKITFTVIGLIVVVWLGYLTYLNLFVPRYMDGYQGTHGAEVMVIDKGYEEINKDYWLKGIESDKLINDDDSTYFIVKEKDDWTKIELNSTYLLDYYTVEKIKRNNKHVPVIIRVRDKLD